jgi:hypothetical protein
MTNGKAVMKPMTMVETNAQGTAVTAFLQSSAKWIAPSRPEYMNAGLTRPVRNTMPSDDHPESLTKVVHTNSLEFLGLATARHATKNVKKQSKEMATVWVSYIRRVPMPKEKGLTANIMSPRGSPEDCNIVEQNPNVHCLVDEEGMPSFWNEGGVIEDSNS